MVAIAILIIIIATDLIVAFTIVFIEHRLKISLEINSIVDNGLIDFAPYLITTVHLLQLLPVH